MNTEDIKKEYVMALREKFSHTSRPYEDIAGWALNDFIADYIVKKLALYNVVKSLTEHLIYQKAHELDEKEFEQWMYENQ